LDGLRGVAILLVLTRHWIFMRPGNLLEMFIVAEGRVGWIGVDLFFVLSGFLITNVLLRSRAEPHYWRHFYLRRALRILPPYFAVLLALTALAPLALRIDPRGVQVFFAEAGWYWSHTTNVLVAKGSTFDSMPFLTGPFWSLAIEEQYYLFWPAVVAWVPSRRLITVCMCFAAASAILRAILVLHGTSQIALFVLLPTHLDGLALGSALAGALADLRVRQYLIAAGRWLARLTAPSWTAGYIGLVALLFALNPSGGYASEAAETIGLPVVAFGSAVLLLATLASPPNTPLARTLRIPWLRWLGRRSYVIYLVHSPVSYLLDALGLGIERLPRVNGSELPAELMRIALAAIITIALAESSWHLLERPFERLKYRLT
jgi:peptidoglycan/LPS O-acetylase OafA/YrhL